MDPLKRWFLVEIPPYYGPYLKRWRKCWGRFLVEITPYYRPYFKRRRRKIRGAFFSRNYALLSTFFKAPQAKNFGGDF